MNVKQTSIFAVFFILMCVCLNAQNSDSVKIDSGTKKAIYSSARKATIMSASLPGLGQAYNKKYWKLPVIYAALGGISYWGINNQIQYKYYSNNLQYENDNNPTTTNISGFSNDQLITQKRYYRKFRDIALMLGIIVYLGNILDANIDAHLKTFDVSDDLSLQIKPYTNFDYNFKLQTGITLKLKFK